MSKDDARAAGKADQGTDYCDLYGWYDDGVCDDFCLQPDPACGQGCDPTLMCGQASTCVDGKNYPTTCGPANCDQPIGDCDAADLLTADEFLTGVEEAAQVEGRVLDYLSESDFPVLGAVLGAAPSAVSGENTFAAFETVLLDGVFEDVQSYEDELTFDAVMGAEGRAQIEAFSDPNRFDPIDPRSAKEQEAWDKLVTIVTTRLQSVHFIKIGPKDSAGDLKDDSGLYAYGFVGVTKDDKLVAVYFGSVET
jgi:hypothetical protein